jgi:CHAD domain-containing protein
MGNEAIRRLVGDAVKARLARFLRNLKRALKHPGDDPIHDLRVAVRRLAASLLTARELRVDGAADDVLAQLDTLMRPLGKLRDAQVQMALIQTLGKLDRKTISAYADLIEQREGRFRAKSQKAMKRLDAARVKKGCRLVRAALDGQPAGTAALRQAASQAGQRILQRCYRAMRVYRQMALVQRNLMALHKMRLALKRLRYTAEVLQAAIPELGAGRMRLFGQYQTYMGDIHDLDVLARNIEKFYGLRRTSPVRRVLDRLRRNRGQIFERLRKSFGKMEKDGFWRSNA